MNPQRRRAYRPSPYDPQPDLRGLLRWARLRIADVERRAGMSRGSLSRILAGKRGRGMRHSTGERLAKAIGVPLRVFWAALERTLDEREEFRRRCAEAERVRREAE